MNATGYRTDAERYGWSFVFAGLLPAGFPIASAVTQAPWWRQVYGADWRHPEGKLVPDRADGPSGGACLVERRRRVLPMGRTATSHEAEWEYAARGGLENARYAWGDELTPGGRWMCNIWQGTFPTENTMADGYLGSAPVEAFDPNGFGLHNVAGNVWEWCADWFTATHPNTATADPKVRGRRVQGHPRRLLPVPPLLLQPVPRRGPNSQHTGQLHREHGIPLRRHLKSSRGLGLTLAGRLRLGLRPCDVGVPDRYVGPGPPGSGPRAAADLP